MKIWIPVAIVVLLLGGWFLFDAFAPTFNVPRTVTPEALEEGSAIQAPEGAGEAEEVSFLTLPEGFKAYYFSKEVENARVMEFMPDGMLVSQTGAGKVSLLTDRDGNGVAEVKTVLSDLSSPHGLATRCEGSACDLYVATHSALLKYRYENGVASAREELLALSSARSDRHKTRTLMFLPYPNENRLLISVGSSCDVCFDEGQRGKIIWYDIETGESGDYATGLRNAVFMALHPVSGDVFMTEMGRDNLGDNLPPDEVNVIPADVSGVPNFGWPACYGKNVFDDVFNANIRYIKNPCEEPDALPSWLDLQAHSAPLGLSFIPEEGWNEDMWFDLLIAYHGSWNRSVPTGYKIVRVHIDEEGNPTKTEDFITGWLTPSGTKLGRPSGVRVLPGGTIYIADDVLGAVYRVVRE